MKVWPFPRFRRDLVVVNVAASAFIIIIIFLIVLLIANAHDQVSTDLHHLGAGLWIKALHLFMCYLRHLFYDLCSFVSPRPVHPQLCYYATRTL
jgi:hypothetical protein